MTIYTNIYGPAGAGINETTTRPADQSSESNVDSWFGPCVGNDPNTGTKVGHQWLNKIVANFRRAIRGMGVAENDTDDDMLLKAIQKAMGTAPRFADCYLSKVGSNLVLARKGGYRLTFPNGEHVPMPLAGATLAPTGLTPGTFQYIYAHKSGVEVALEAAATAPAVDASSGIEIKTGDATRVKVGAAYIDTGPVFRDEDGKLWVLSHFNRKRKASVKKTASNTTGAGLLTALRNEFIAWADEHVFAHHVHNGHASGNSSQLTGIAWNSTTTASDSSAMSNDAGDNRNLTVISVRKPGELTEAAANYATVISNSETAYGTGALRCQLQIETAG